MFILALQDSQPVRVRKLIRLLPYVQDKRIDTRISPVEVIFKIKKNII